MGWTMDGVIDPDEALRMLDALSGEADSDFVMLVENKGAPVEGESRRAFEDGKKRMDVGGYYFSSQVVTPPGSTKGQVRSSSLMVVRRCDAATASLASLLKNQDSQLKVQLSVFKAGGDSSPDMQPTLEFVLDQARVTVQVLVAGGTPKRPCEILVFHYRSLEIRSAPQQTSGQRGAVRIATLTA